MKTLSLAALGASLLAAPALAQAPTPAPAAASAPAGIGPGFTEAQRGAWYGGDCAAPTGMMFVTARSLAVMPEEGDGRLLRITGLATQANGWTVATGRGPLAPRLILRGAGETLETAQPSPKAKDPELPGAAPVETWRRCPSMAPGLALKHGEGIAFLAQLEKLEAACGTGSTMAGCLDAVVAAGDITGDKLLGRAEVARLTRGIAWVIAMQEDGSQSTVGAAVGGGALGGVLASRLMMEMFDYNSDGMLSSAELGQDRIALPDATGAVAGAPLQTDGVGQGAGALKAMIDGLLGR